MPRLLVFAPCEKVIISRDENNPTLIAILSQVGGSLGDTIPPGAAPDAHPAVPFQWSIFTLWHLEPSDTGRRFEQVIVLRSPSGKEIVRAPQEFEMSKNTHRLTMRLPWF